MPKFTLQVDSAVDEMARLTRATVKLAEALREATKEAERLNVATKDALRNSTELRAEIAAAALSKFLEEE